MTAHTYDDAWTVIVLGDISHSPRMCNHIDMLHRYYKVQVICYGTLAGTESHSLPTFQFNHLFLFWSAVKFALQVLYLFYYLIRYPTTNILVQNPPSIQALFSLTIIKLFSNKFVVLDWHNLGYSILQTRTEGPIIEIYKKLEFTLARIASVNLAVSNEMCEFLRNTCDLRNVQVLYDYPPETFKALDPSEQTRFWHTLSSYSELSILQSIDVEKTIKLVTSTSYTPDEDIFMLLDALNMLDDYLRDEIGTKVIVFITGKGPLRTQAESRINNLRLKHIQICCVWLKYEDYSKLLASCDVGISLHASSSGLDLPMKIWDMFGCGLPVFALDYRALYELVDHKYGYTFQDSNSLFRLLVSQNDGLFDLTECKKRITLDFNTKRWPREWQTKMLSLI
eukprot:NODE_374_length_9848_cov_0.468971.p3 type:complete len:395 gc:universal NODE_374_length_9848_cov_0.468971:5575-6759(+)